MSKILNFPEHGGLREEAAYWLVKLDGGELGEEDAAALREWLLGDPGHERALVELAGLWDEMDIVSQLSELFPLGHTRSSGQERPRSGFRKTVLPAAVATAVVILAIGTAIVTKPVIVDNDPSVPAHAETAYRTTVGEQSDVILPDGSVAKLNTDSLLEVEYSDRQRDISLLRGEAYFEVRKAPDRPFVVHAGEGTVRAIGTAFNVRLTGEGVEVTVSEGRVEIASATKPDANPAGFDKPAPAGYLTTLKAGQQAIYDEQAIHSVQTIARETLSRDLSWQHGVLVFSGETLDEVVGEISRYTQTEIFISDPEIRDIRVGGYFRTGEVESLLAVLKDSFPIQVDRINDDLVYLSGKGVVQAED